MIDRSSRATGRAVGLALVASLAIVAVIGGLALGLRLGATGGAAPAVGSSAAIGSSSSGPDGSGGPLSSPGASPVGTPSSSPTPAPLPTPELVPAPLTGLLVPAASARFHPVAVMVDDHRDARPQSGFNAAAVVWQAPAEGGIPRYMLVFQDTIPASVGPIRSARQYYVDWASEWDALYVHVGGSPQALATLRAGGAGALVWDADEFRYGTRAMWRVTNRPAPHNAYTDGQHVRSLAAAIGAADGPLAPVWSFGPDEAPDRRPATGTITVTYPYETVAYRYDPATNAYHRFIDGSTQPQVDAADGLVVAPKNVVILRMRFGLLNDGNPEKGRLEASDVGTGEAWVSSNGRTFRAVWRKDSQTAPTLLQWPDGSPVRLTAGQTFVQVIALSYGFTVADGPGPWEQRSLRANE